MKYIRIKGASQNNLKNISLDIPRDRLVVITGAVTVSVSAAPPPVTPVGEIEPIVGAGLLIVNGRALETPVSGLRTVIWTVLPWPGPFETYLATELSDSEQRVRVINLCNSYSYLSDGYYCSLLAEARGHHVIPSVKVLNDLGKQALYQFQLEDLSPSLARAFKSRNNKDIEITLLSYFGTTAKPLFKCWQGYCLSVFHVLCSKFRYASDSSGKSPI